ncbi:succinate dehydrogenase, cytochrome b556 subunit [Rhodobacter sphaeroides]|jgi:succinate dehydrogenase / fumarate reductase cytochrome b subunit|uniref:Succinate dehydrogenase cytochrome b556 subunit n=3 Tax=Cereibacter TaxID=1653176 RepID=Q3IZ77_CERS4|nr:MULTISPECIES: succinate dehydrogenase, cytochrome b556 subunit [Cereibacter]ABN77736.1 succinate dehydrogenase subunit C [Cereibacter sphaeroides ATCC 17029]EKX58040.1 Succinate dehydrogenase cytochrome b-556 subunit [Rhodobacter sp. AKP1]ABA80157.1 succinate dehydrogenase subunit C [Cereibacter sphaeroides 2.4.1]ACM02226.1 Succinate dehydrogenase subunit C [Cereibacter sphaeroides KD131]AMJ48401.1 succinate dehydrogenase [Cereibacter sphaeroides]
MAETKRVERPLSPHLQIYRVQLTSTTSIFTRLTGNGLIVGTMLVTWWLLAAALSPEQFETADWVLTSWFGDIVLLLSVWALWYHYLAGLRHLYWDTGKGLEIKTAEKLGMACIGGSLVLTLLTVIII